MLNKAPLKVSNLKQLYIRSLMSRIDTMVDPSEMMRMDFNEFLALMDREAVDAEESQVMAFSSPQFIAASSEGEPESDVAETMAANDDEMTSV